MQLGSLVAVVVALIQPLAWELPYAVGVARKKDRRQKKKKKKKKNSWPYDVIYSWIVYLY